MKRVTPLFLVLLALLFSPLTASEVRRHVDQFKKYISYIGPLVRIESGRRTVLKSYTYSLVAGHPIGKKDDMTFMITLRSMKNIKGHTWSHWTEMRDTEGTELKIAHRDSEIGRPNGGIHDQLVETIAASVTREYLNKVAKSGMAMRVYGKSENCDFFVTASEVSRFLSYLDSASD